MWKRAVQHTQRRASARAVGAIRNKHEARSYIEQYARSIQRPDEFWAEAAEEVEWFKRCDKVLDRYALAQCVPTRATWQSDARAHCCHGYLSLSQCAQIDHADAQVVRRWRDEHVLQRT